MHGVKNNTKSDTTEIKIRSILFEGALSKDIEPKLELHAEAGGVAEV